MRNRSADFRSQQRQSRIQGHAQRVQTVDFFNVLTGPELLEKTEALLPEHREREYPPTVALAMFLKQALSQDRSCQRAVNGWIAQCVAEGLKPPSSRTGGYSRARGRLPMQMVVALAQTSGQLLCRQAPAGWRWRGRVVKLGDGTGISMPDTAQNQSRYPQPSSQAEGVGFPQMRLTGVICLSSGAVLDAAVGPHAGKGSGELGLIRQLEQVFQAGDVFLADALYCNYFLIAKLQGLGVDVLFEQNGARITDFRRGERLGVRQHLVRWEKPKARPQWMTPEEYRAHPQKLTVREVEVDGRVLVTTMIDPRRAPKRELARLYERRWNIELDFRNIKTTLGMEVLSCKSPPMCEKELWVYLLAYNLIRLLMAQAALQAGIHPRQLSFKHTVQLWSEWVARGLAGLSAHADVLFRVIAEHHVGNRPGRIEPRARKRRPKPYQWLKVPRTKARRQVLLYGYLPNPST